MQQEERFDEGVGNIEDNIEPIMHRQIDGSRGIFEAQVRVSNAEIDGIKLKNQRKEKDRRFEEELARAKRLEDIEKEKHFADRKNAELDLRWAEYKEMEECQELAQSLNEHKAMFKDLIAKKQALINSLQDHIRKKDEEYIREMEAMKNEIDDIVSKMRSQFHGLRDLAQEQLTIVEQDLSKQRSDLISKNQTEINERFKMLKDKESESAEARIKQERDEAIDLENTRIKQDKEFMNAKISAEIEIQNCEKCHENMKALYMLNSEKLNYNHKVLSEKTDENANISAQLKAKDNDYRDQLKQRKEDYVKDHDALNQQNKKLTRQYTAISKQYKDLHKKFEHFVITDTLRYKEIYKMNENEIQAVKQRIINCDKIIHLQQLGVVWEPFDETQVVKEEMSRVWSSS
jgi:dynein regulatory complex protein 1